MANKRPKPEDIVTKLRPIEVLTAQYLHRRATQTADGHVWARAASRSQNTLHATGDISHTYDYAGQGWRQNLLNLRRRRHAAQAQQQLNHVRHLWPG